HDLGRDRGGVEAALATIRARTLALAVDTDRLFPPSQSWRIAEGVPRGIYRELRSDHGHDGFLTEHDQVGAILSDFLAALDPLPPPFRPPPSPHQPIQPIRGPPGRARGYRSGVPSADTVTTYQRSQRPRPRPPPSGRRGRRRAGRLPAAAP